MKKAVMIIIYTVCIFSLSSCKQLHSIITGFNKSTFGNELASTSRIVFENNKEKAMKFTVADSKVIKQIVEIMGKSSISEADPGVSPDYTINFYLPNGRQKSFDYWMGASQNNRETNLKDENGLYYKVPYNLDTYIINSTKMYDRPQKFVELYSACISDSISSLKTEGGNTTVGIDIKSDRRMRKYTISYEEEELFNRIKAEGFDIHPYTAEGEYTYVVSYVTNIYNPDKAQITVEVMNTKDKTKQVFTYQPKLVNGAWEINRTENSK